MEVMNDTPVLDLNISDILIAPEPFPDVAEQLSSYAKNRLKIQCYSAMFRMGKLNVYRGKRPHRTEDGTKYTSVPKAQRKSSTRAKTKIVKASRKKNRV